MKRRNNPGLVNKIRWYMRVKWRTCLIRRYNSGYKYVIWLHLELVSAVGKSDVILQ
jgi:hypothetical protein